jgi:hypothetical protein
MMRCSPGIDMSLSKTPEISKLFACHLCKNIAREPRECNNCGKVYCGPCISE